MKKPLSDDDMRLFGIEEQYIDQMNNIQKTFYSITIPITGMIVFYHLYLVYITY
jgi:predicted carbohydrate-binding protein with CBM5 and CBM33 domain